MYADDIPIPRNLHLTYAMPSARITTCIMIFNTAPNLRRQNCDDSTNFPFFRINGEKIESTDNIKFRGAQIGLSLNLKEQINVGIRYDFKRNTNAKSF